MRPDTLRLLPAAVLALGALGMLATRQQQRRFELTLPLTALPTSIAGYTGSDLQMLEEQRRAAAPSQYNYRLFTRGVDRPFSVYVGYYDHQEQGSSSIHSPKNCLPGAGWQTIESGTVVVNSSLGRATVNRYVLDKDGERVLAYYWYQGRGRIESNEFAVRLNLLRDAAFRGRSDESLVRIVMSLPPRADAATDRQHLAVAGRLAERAAAEYMVGLAYVLSAAEPRTSDTARTASAASPRAALLAHLR